MYDEEFFEALQRTRRFGLSAPELLKTEQNRFLNDKVKEELPFVICKSLGVLEEDEIVAQCLLLNMRLRSVFSKYLDTSVYYTIGYVGISGDYMFKQTEESLLSMLKHGIPGPSVSLHAWLTLPSMEILDFSFSTSYGKANGLKEMMGSALSLHPSELTGGLSYHPMLVGEDFLCKTGAMSLVIDLGI